MRRYRFSDYTLSPRRRVLLRAGTEVPLIPRYFDLLVFLVEHRHEAVHRRDIFDRVWSDVIVSDSALSQAIRTIRRALDDDPREPRFVRTVSRHGYRFVCDDVIEEEDSEGDGRSVLVATVPVLEAGESVMPVRLPAVVSAAPASAWPLWVTAASGGASAGGVAGAAGGLLLIVAPGASAAAAVVPVLALIGLVCGGMAAAGVGFGLQVAAPRGGTRRLPVLMAGAALGGVAVGTLVQWMSRWMLAALVGVHLPTGGGLEGLVIGAAAGLGYGWAVQDAPAPPFGSPQEVRTRLVAITAVCCGVASLALALAGRPLVGGTLHALADLAQGAQTSLAPLGRVLGEPGFGRLTSALIAMGEGAIFGAGLAWGLHRAPRPTPASEP